MATAYAGNTVQIPQVRHKKVKRAPLHERYVAPLSFLVDAYEKSSFRVGAVGEKFGSNGEGYVRKCYEEILGCINADWRESVDQDFDAMLAIVRGSSGVGKSTFMSFLLARYRQQAEVKDVAIFYAPKAAKSMNGMIDNSEIHCVVWLDGEKKIDGNYVSVRDGLISLLPKLKIIIMDGCSMPFSTEGFNGVIVVAASPSLYVKNLKDEIFFHKYYTMAILDEDEAKAMAKVVNVSEAMAMDNFKHMNGIARYLFAKDAAKKKVEDAVKSVSTSSIEKMVAMQASDKREETVAVHSLVQWNVSDCRADPTFELVSRYAERLVAKKLCQESMENLKTARLSMSPLSGAEGYAGALFEALAIRTIQQGGNFTLRCLTDEKVQDVTLSIPRIEADPIVVEGNNLTTALVSYDDVRVKDGNAWSPRLLWPTTTNFPTFDCFYFHTDGEVYPLQMTIAAIHVLKNNGANQARKYFDGMFGSTKADKHKAVFVVPKDTAAHYKKQQFKGKVDKKDVDMGHYFDQWVMGI